MTKRAVVIGGGVNGLVAAHYLNQAGYAVVVLERKPTVGGACSSRSVSINGKHYTFADGASVLGIMPRFIFEETGLSSVCQTFVSPAPPIVYFEDMEEPARLYEDPAKLVEELHYKWFERGRTQEFLSDFTRVIDWLRQLYKEGLPPNEASAREQLGDTLYDLWITGSAADLVQHYFTSQRSALYWTMFATENGITSAFEPHTAFTIALMNAGDVFNGLWGYIKGGPMQLAKHLAELLIGRGVAIINNAAVKVIDDTTVTWAEDDELNVVEADVVVLATDPKTAAKVVGDHELYEEVSKKELRGGAGKQVLFFDKPVQWTYGTKDGHAFRYIFPHHSLGNADRALRDVKEGKEVFAPGHFELYPDGRANYILAGGRGHDAIAVYFTNISDKKGGAYLPEVKEQIQDTVLRYINNRKDFVGSILMTPKDLKERFYFGNVDHVELCQGQTFTERTFSNDPETSFYRFGSNERHYYCGAGGFPCGGVAGTVGYLCAREITRE